MIWNVNHLRVWMRDRDLQITEEIPWLSIDVQLHARRVSTWSITCNTIPRVMRNIERGGGVVIKLGNHTVLEGFIDVIGPHRWDFVEGTNYITLSGRDDLCVVADEIAWPFPTVGTGGIQKSEEHATYEGPAETALISLLGANVGTNRHANRTILDEPTDPWLVEMPTSQGRGPVKQLSTRYDPLMELVRMALEESDLDITCQPNEDRTGIALEFIQYRDLTDDLTFSSFFQNLKDIEYQESIPEFNSMILSLESHDQTVETSGNDPDETIRRRRIRGRHFQTHGAFPNTQQQWRRRIAQFDDAGDLREDPENQTGTEASVIRAVDDYALPRFIRATSQTGVQATLISSARAQLFTNFRLGDRVTLIPQEGFEFQERISSIGINADSGSGRLDITPTVGHPGDDPSEELRDKIQRRTFERIQKVTGV